MIVVNVCVNFQKLDHTMFRASRAVEHFVWTYDFNRRCDRISRQVQREIRAKFRAAFPTTHNQS